MYSGHQPRQSTKDAPHGRRCIGRCRSVRQPEPGVRRKQRPPPANQQRDLVRSQVGLSQYLGVGLCIAAGSWKLLYSGLPNQYWPVHCGFRQSHLHP
eukprot:jgi/Botrbrau1/8741/Bobra.0090s0016.1